MHRMIIAIGALFGAAGVAAGAFGAHGLKKITGDQEILHMFQTASQYQLWHALAIVLTGVISGSSFHQRLLRWSAGLFVAGILLFSGSLYGITFLKINGSELVRVLGPVTPLGGLCLIAGWLTLAISVLRKK
ncbi:MAG: DUF423 domain-containing protein [Chitinophagaceae bacterium]